MASLSATVSMVRGSLALPFPRDEDMKTVACDLPADVVSTQPGTHYLFSKTYGWFDTAHFFTGNPAKIIQDVKEATRQGGGTITITQDVRNGITGYTAHYRIAGNIPPAKRTDVALGIYLDWSHRFEAWQDAPPRGLFGPFTAFAIEDLPSHYVGFFATAHELDPAYVLACYLGGMETTTQAPPRLVAPEHLPGSTSSVDVPIQHLTNKTFTPLIWQQGRWRNVPWPRSMRMEAISSSSGLWRFESDETWYLDKQLTLIPSLAERQ
jgi:hypothetical protein